MPSFKTIAQNALHRLCILVPVALVSSVIFAAVYIAQRV
jgi:hypothetical protein